MRAFLAGAMLVGALGCGQVEENPFEPDGSNPDPVGAALVFSGDQVSWRSTTPGLPRLQVALPGERTSVYAWPPKESPPDTAGVLELLAWPEDTQDSLDLALFIEDDAGHDLLVLSERVSSQGQREPDVGSCLRATMIDVGWGDAHLLEAPSGRRLLIDTGSWDNQSQLRTFLGDRLTSTSPEGHLIDDLVLTHLHADHVSGFEATVTYDYDVGTVYFSSPYYEYGYGYTYERLRSKALDSGAEVLEPRTGDRIEFDPTGEVEILVLNAGNPFSPSSDEGQNENNSSMVLRVDYGAVSFVYTGDAETPLINQLRGRWAGGLEATVLKVGHHGSGDATERIWAQDVSAQVALVPIDAGQVECALPRDEVIGLLQGAGATVFRSDSIIPGAAFRRDITGHVEVISDGRTITVRTLPTHRAAEVDCG